MRRGFVSNAMSRLSHPILIHKVTDNLSLWGAWLLQMARGYFMVLMYVALIVLMRVTILVLSIPLLVTTNHYSQTSVR